MHRFRTQILHWADITIFTLCFLGLIASFILSILGLFSIQQSLTGFSALFGKLTLFALIPVGGLFIARYQALTYNVPPNEISKMRYYGCPKWMRIATYSCMVIGVCLFFLPAILEWVGFIPKSNGDSIPSTLPGGFGMLTYSSLFAQLYSLKNQYGSDGLHKPSV